MLQDILIIDDDEVLLFLHEVIITDLITENTTIRPYNNATDAFYYLDSIKNENKSTLILLDLNMPEVSGWDFLDKLNEASFKDNIIVIIITSSINSSDKSKAKLYSQVIQFMEKPLLVDNIQDWKKNSKLNHFFA
ncbi:MAG: response regulator [Flavobacterium sp.]